MVMAPVALPFECRAGVWVMDLPAAIGHWGEG